MEADRYTGTAEQEDEREKDRHIDRKDGQIEGRQASKNLPGYCA